MIADYINGNIEQKYNTTTILDIYDENISLIRQEHEWGYSVPYHIAAGYVCHPNYAAFLMNKQTLIMKDIEQIIISIPKSERGIFNKKLIEELYIRYQNKKINDQEAVDKVIEIIKTKKVLVLAPGKTLSTEHNKILTFIEKENPYVISVNFLDGNYYIDACFVSNHKRIDSIMSERKN